VETLGSGLRSPSQNNDHPAGLQAPGYMPERVCSRFDAVDGHERHDTKRLPPYAGRGASPYAERRSFFARVLQPRLLLRSGRGVRARAQQAPEGAGQWSKGGERTDGSVPLGTRGKILRKAAAGVEAAAPPKSVRPRR